MINKLYHCIETLFYMTILSMLLALVVHVMGHRIIGDYLLACSATFLVSAGIAGVCAK